MFTAKCMCVVIWSCHIYQFQVTCQLLGVILEETTPEELQVDEGNLIDLPIIVKNNWNNEYFKLLWQKHATVRSSVCEVLLEITKFCDLYLMERILDDESEVRAYLDGSHVTVYNNIVLQSDNLSDVNHRALENVFSST